MNDHHRPPTPWVWTSFTRKDQRVIFNGFKGCRQDAKGEGKYLEGGKEAGGQLVDQRFCPRIVEGEGFPSRGVGSGSEDAGKNTAPWRTWTISKGKPHFISKHQFSIIFQTTFKSIMFRCAHEICVPAAGVPPAEHENAKTRKRQARKREKTKTAKTRKRRKHNPFRSTLNTNVITDLGMCRYVRQQSIPYTSNTNFITALGMCKVCTEAAQSVALWTWTLSQLWACVCTEAVLPVALWTWTLSQLWACVKYVPKQSTA